MTEIMNFRIYSIFRAKVGVPIRLLIGFIFYRAGMPTLNGSQAMRISIFLFILLITLVLSSMPIPAAAAVCQERDPQQGMIAVAQIVPVGEGEESNSEAGEGFTFARLDIAVIPAEDDFAPPLPTDLPQNGDFDGDCRYDKAFFRPETATWFIVGSSSGELDTVKFGLKTDVPAPDDYDEDGITDIAIWRDKDQLYYVLRSRDRKLQMFKKA
jgi:hypothetical protein